MAKRKDRELNPERMLTVNDICELLQLSRGVVTRLFENEPGVLKLGHAGSVKKRKYEILRVPRPVYDRRIRGLTVGQRR